MAGEGGGPGDGALPEKFLKQAAIWHARLREDDRHRKAFALWLGEDPRKAEAFRQTERLWAALEAPTAALATDGAALMVRRQRRPPIIWRRSAGRRVDRKSVV